MIPVQQPSFTIPAGGSFPLQCNGRYFRIQSATGALRVVGDTFGNMGAVGVGQGLHLREHDPQFQRLTFIDTSGAPNIVTVVIADSDFVDNSLLGTVSVVDGGKARTLAGGAFLGSVSSPPVAANYSHAQLWNPVGSGKNVILSQITIGGPSAMNVSVRDRNAALANPSPGGAPMSKKMGGAASATTLLRYEAAAAYIYTTNQDIVTFAVQANVTVAYKFVEPMVLPPGWGLVAFSNSTQNAQIAASFEFIEELI